MLTEQKSTDTEPKAEQCGDGGKTHWDACPCRQRAHKATVDELRSDNDTQVQCIQHQLFLMQQKDEAIVNQLAEIRAHKAHVQSLYDICDQKLLRGENLMKEIDNLQWCIERRQDAITSMEQTIFEQSNTLQTQAGQIEHLTQENNYFSACIVRRDAALKALQFRAERAEQSLAQVSGTICETIGVKR